MKLAITCGDPAGIGPEIIAGWLAANPNEAKEVAIIGPPSWLKDLPSGAEKVLVGLESFSAVSGRPDGEGALVAWAALDTAAAGCREGRFSGVVTAPISKARLSAIGWGFPGQTEFFAARWGGEPTMAFCGGKLKVVLLTWHIPLRQVPDHLTEADFARAAAAADELARKLGKGRQGKGREGSPNRPWHPRIAVCGLNPHAGEGGLIGTEEKEVIDPILDRLRRRFPGLSRAEPGDTAFARQMRGEFDVVLALYHDQGLAPLKTVDFDSAVNVTLGLPFVRTSPDHGTAFGIAGKGMADGRSFANAVRVARRLVEATRG